jgi:hypothetical protein
MEQLAIELVAKLGSDTTDLYHPDMLAITSYKIILDG